MTDDSTPVAEAAAATIRSIVPPPDGDENGLRAYVTGEVGFEADRSEAVKSIDETLLLVTCAVLVLLLLAIYRSPLVALVPLLVVAVAYVVAGGLTYMLVRAGVTGVSGQTTAILIVLMFGVGHRLLPADRRPLPRRAAPHRRRRRGDGAGHRAHRPGDPLGGRDRDRGDARARRSRTSTPRARWARSSRSASPSWSSPG